MAMRPVLVDFGVDLPVLGHLDLPSYFVLLSLSFILGTWMTWREAPRMGLDRERVLDLDIYIVIAAIAGARLLHVIADGHFHDYLNLCLDNFKVRATEAKVAFCNVSKECGWDYVCNVAAHTCHPPRDCFAVLEVWRGGLTFYGGLIVATIFGLSFARRHRMSMGKVADLCAPWIASGLALTRLGCFLNGCCYGKITSVPWAVRFPAGSPSWQAQHEAGLIADGAAALPVHPTQIYLSLLNLATFLLLIFAVKPRKKFDGQVFAWLLILKGIFRSLVEIWRDDDRGVFFGFLSTSQIISLPLVAFGVFLLVRGGRAAARPSSPVPLASEP
jgi:phosphatidylglycerol:prolipoprotein diacylglycerol transferase